ncbi:hypothetical protein L9F63_011117, partial [Diploptera punctata]
RRFRAVIMQKFPALKGDDIDDVIQKDPIYIVRLVTHRHQHVVLYINVVPALMKGADLMVPGVDQILNSMYLNTIQVWLIFNSELEVQTMKTRQQLFDRRYAHFNPLGAMSLIRLALAMMLLSITCLLAKPDHIGGLLPSMVEFMNFEIKDCNSKTVVLTINHLYIFSVDFLLSGTLTFLLDDFLLSGTLTFLLDG